MIDYLKTYTTWGLQIIPIHPGSKVPIGERWNDNWSLRAVERIFDSKPDSNIGILLGLMIDVEGDTPEANDFLDDILKNDPHPIWQSHRSRHHLFLSPNRKFQYHAFNGIEFRGHRHQSVLPPSHHSTGLQYEWVSQEFPVPMLPKCLAKMLKMPGAQQFTKPWCSVCGDEFKVDATRFKRELMAFKTLGQAWSCRKCRRVDVRKLCRSIRKNPTLYKS
tara:strand:+ start:2171 stop:2827 length:657 start_codon:yes stop_codon:yes gene_type:complete